MRRRVVVAAVVVLAVLVGGLVSWRLWHRTSTFAGAVQLLPADTLRASYTDWATARRLAGGANLGAASPAGRVNAFLNRAYNRDLTVGSAVDDSTLALSRHFGFSALDAEWEILGQSKQGQVDILRMRDDTDLAGLENTLRTLGYTEPSSGLDTGGTWVGGADLVARISSGLTPIEQNFVVLPDRHLVLMSDGAQYLTAAARAASGKAAGLDSVAGVQKLAELSGQPDSAVLWAGTFACVDLSMGSASSDEQRVGAQLVAKVGGINPLSGLVMAQQTDRSVVVVMHFDTSGEAAANLQPRVDLASGLAPGQGGSFASRFRVVEGSAKGQEASMTLRPSGERVVLSDMSQGPVLFATC